MAVTKKQADETFWTLGQETASTTSPISDKTDLVQRSYVATSFTVDENGEKAASDSLRAGFADTFGELNGLWADGSINMEVPEGEGILPIAQAILGDQTPVSTAVSEKRLVSAVGVNTVDDATYFTDTTTTAVKVLDDGDLTTGTSFAPLTATNTSGILDDLNSYTRALTLTLTASAVPNNATDIIINYNEDGESQSATIAFATTATTGMFSLPANSRLTSVEYTAGDWTGSQTLDIDVDLAIKVLDDGDLTGGTSFAPLDDLNSDTRAFILTLTASAVPNAAADIVINYDQGGASQSGTVSFTTSDTSQTFDLPANSRITSIGYTAANWTGSQTLDIDAAATNATSLIRSPDFNQPGKLNFVLSGAISDLATIRVNGLRKVGISSRDWLVQNEDIDANGTGTDFTSEKYFRTINGVDFLDSSGNAITSAITVTITSQPGGYETVVKVADEILPKYTLEAEVAEVPRLVTGARFVGATINNEDTLEL